MPMAHNTATPDDLLKQRISEVDARSYTGINTVHNMRELLYDITGEQRWMNNEYYRGFAVSLSGSLWVLLYWLRISRSQGRG